MKFVHSVCSIVLVTLGHTAVHLNYLKQCILITESIVKPGILDTVTIIEFLALGSVSVCCKLLQIFSHQSFLPPCMVCYMPTQGRLGLLLNLARGGGSTVGLEKLNIFGIIFGWPQES